MKVQARYAPSPTGNQHIGGVRTALFNYLFARSMGGKFILRLEDTDRTRCDEKYVRNLYDTFDWLGFHWDEGPDVGGPNAPYIQSERSELYKKYADGLVEKDRAYYCFCTAERLDEVRKEREASHSSESGYDRHCRKIARDEAGRRAASGEAHTIRLKIPLGEDGNETPVTAFYDHVLGDIEWKNDAVNPDPVLLKSDGFPTYHLANIVDDHLMGITHVLRAQEWMPSTPLHVIMYRAFGWEPPQFCHLPMVMGTDGKKLSKRHGATGIDEFRSQGFLPEALINYIALLGCSYEEGKDFYALEELAVRFSLEKLSKAPAVFDYKKLEWYNASYIRGKGDGELAALSIRYAIEQGLFGKAGQAPDSAQKALYTAAMPLVKERAVFLSDLSAKLNYLFTEIELPPKEEFFPKKANLGETIELLTKGRSIVGALAAAASDEEAENLVKAFAEKEGLKLGDLMMPLRVAITGTRVSPPLFGSLRLLGSEKAIERTDRAIKKITDG
ncbi:MAG: glutamate--tRNA ligase [Treponema sp.]|jgi:glutamyl-tRNA synthetase|nr:glutamate--tRNA ligase [Treponema sp.]